MADKTVSVSLVGRDNLSQVFAKVGQSAQQAGKNIDQAGRTASASLDAIEKNTADTVLALNRLVDATDKAEKSATRTTSTWSKLGATVGTAVTAGLLLSVRAAADAEVSQQRLQTTIEATGALFEQYAGQIDAVNNKALSLSFDDEDAQDALSQLIQATGDVEASMDQMGLAMDIARGRGIDLASATKIVIAADQERFTALKRLGIQIDENSTKESVLADLQQKYAGQAQAYAETNAGAFDRWQNSIENAAESVGAFLGPAQQLLLVFPGIAAGFTGMAGAIAKIGSMGGATSVLSSLPALLMGPVGIAGAAVAAGVAIVALANHFSTDLPTASQAAIEAMQELINKIVEAGDQSEYALMLLQLDDVMRDNKKTVDEYKDSFTDLVLIQAKLKDQGGADISSDIFANLSQSQRELIDGNHDLWVTYDEVTAAVDTWASHAADAAAVNDGLAAGMDELEQIWRMTGEAGDFAKSQAQAYTAALEAGDITPERYEQLLNALITGYENAGEAALASGESVKTNTAAIDENGTAMERWAAIQVKSLDNVARSMQQLGQGSVTLGSLFGHMIDPFTLRAQNQLDNVSRQMAAMGSMSPKMGAPGDTGAFDQAFQGVKAGANAAAEAQRGLQVSIANASDAMTYQVGESQRLADALESEAADKAEAMKAATDAMTRSFNAATAAATGTTRALDSGFQVVVGNTNAIAKSSQQVRDWAGELIGASGTVATMDNLLARNVITQEDYNAAQQAFYPIAVSNMRIQDDVLAIQTRQAPVLADLTEAQADYMDKVAAMGPEQQAFNLAMMDSATSAQALQLATGLLGDQGDVFAPMVEAAANLDPYLATILDQMGLISQQEDGTWTVTLDDQATSPMEDLAASMRDLTDQIYILTTYLDDDEANDGISQLESQLADLSAFVATPTVTVNDFASSVLGGIMGTLNNINGMFATATVQTNYVTTGSVSGGYGPQLASGGTISPYGYSRAAANGMTATLVGERGPEVVMLPGGSQVMNTEGSRSRWSGGGGFTFNNYGTIVGVDDLKEQIIEAWSKAWQRANYQHERSMGV